MPPVRLAKQIVPIPNAAYLIIAAASIAAQQRRELLAALQGIVLVERHQP